MTKWSLLLPLAVSLLIAPPPASAYADLTSASYYSQLIISAIFGGTLSIRLVWALVVRAIKRQD